MLQQGVHDCGTPHRQRQGSKQDQWASPLGPQAVMVALGAGKWRAALHKAGGITPQWLSMRSTSLSGEKSMP